MQNFVRLVHEARHPERGDEPRAVLVDLLATHGLSPQMVIDALAPRLRRRRAFDTVHLSPGAYLAGHHVAFFRDLADKGLTETNLGAPRTIRDPPMIVARVRMELRREYDWTPADMHRAREFFADWEVDVAIGLETLLNGPMVDLIAAGPAGLRITQTTIDSAPLLHGHIAKSNRARAARVLPQHLAITLSLEGD